MELNKLLDIDPLTEFIKKAQNLIDSRNQGIILSVETGKKYHKIVETQSHNAKARSVFCFVDKTTGDILKAASWSRPAKHSRGNINDENCMAKMTVYGPMYLR